MERTEWNTQELQEERTEWNTQELQEERTEWNTQELQEDFEVIGFQAPYVVVVRKSDDVKGSLEFTHAPRRYFNWCEA